MTFDEWFFKKEFKSFTNAYFEDCWHASRKQAAHEVIEILERCNKYYHEETDIYDATASSFFPYFLYLIDQIIYL